MSIVRDVGFGIVVAAAVGAGFVFAGGLSEKTAGPREGASAIARTAPAPACVRAAALSRDLKASKTLAQSSLRLASRPAPVPDVTLRDPAGDRKLSDLRGRVVLLNVWATWCGYCRGEAPSLVALSRAMSHRRFAVVSLNIDKKDPRGLAQWLREQKLSLSPNVDPEGRGRSALRRVGLGSGVPATLLIDAEGCVVATHLGGGDRTSPEARDLIQTMLRDIEA